MIMDELGFVPSPHAHMIVEERCGNFAATQFEDISARRAFPCFDEPALKATFNVTIAHRPDYVALSNMPIYKTETIIDQTFDHYSKSVLMPTYLLAFAVGDFQSKETVSKNNITMRYYSRPSFVHKLNYALSVGGKIMTYFENLFGVKYSLPKEDMAAIPMFGSGAMENWGLILYQEKYLLWDPKESTESQKLSVTSVIAHELAHMWFGNIVTLNWWNDIWLNEGFASLFASRGMGVAIPALKNEDVAIYKAMRKSMKYDSLPNSNPVSENAGSITSTNDMSGVTFYDKIYLKRHAFANVVTDDLWRALTELPDLHIVKGKI
ncbi:hypothetical protein QZH41_005488 [Actinostola sp. cb2023]|nr:hypothetical protein QZH41_005488 [Actinostola sp. cb2023]